MKILAFGDHHGDIFFLEEVLAKDKKADLAICLGDFTMFSQDIEIIFEELSLFEIPLHLTFGNHEDESTVKTLAKQFPNIHFYHKKSFSQDGFHFLFYGGDGFSTKDKTFERVMKRLSKNFPPEKTVLITHGPPRNTKLDIPYENHHSGSASYRSFIEEFQPLLALSGHIHECEHIHDSIGKTVLINPGPDGEIINLDVLLRRRSKMGKGQITSESNKQKTSNKTKTTKTTKTAKKKETIRKTTKTKKRTTTKSTGKTTPKQEEKQ